jgi:hypothetical protein
MIVSDVAQPSSAPAPGLWDRFVALIKTPEGTLLATAVGALVVGGVVAAASGGSSRRPVALPRVPSRGLLPPYTPYEAPRRRALRQDEQLAINRENGADFEGRAGRKLKRDFPEANVIPQVTVTTPDGRRRRLDYALEHPNGSITAVEVKNVSELTEDNVRQAEDHRAGLQNLGLRAGPTIMMLPAHAVVREEHATRVRVVPIRKRARRG